QLIGFSLKNICVYVTINSFIAQIRKSFYGYNIPNVLVVFNLIGKNMFCVYRLPIFKDSIIGIHIPYARIATITHHFGTITNAVKRSEERRVGKECRSAWWEAQPR